MFLTLIRNCLHVMFMVSMVTSQQHSNAAHSPRGVSIPAKNVTYIQIDPYLIPRRIQDINDMSPLPVDFGKKSDMKKYPVHKRLVQEIILEIEENKEINDMNTDQPSIVKDNGSWKTESEISKSKLKSVLGTDGEVYYDADWGLMSAILTCYNNHWSLKTGPEDWWTVVIRRIVQAMDEHGEVPQVRDFFVKHKGKKKLNIIVGSTLSNIDYNWLFSQFSNGIRKNIKVPGYIDIIENDFSSSTNEQTMISQIMLMSSMKNYFEFGMSTLCGIPGVEMKGTEEDWVKLVDKISDLEELLTPIDKYLGLENWFNTAKTVFANLLDTYRGNPNIEWWVQILSWNERWGSGERPHWSGWFPEFFGVKRYLLPHDYKHFPSDLVTVPIHIEDFNNFPPVEDDGILVAGIVGFSVEEGEHAPVVEPTHAWSVLLPVDSPVADRLTGYTRSVSTGHSNQHQQPTSKNSTINPTEIESDAYIRSASIHKTHRHHLTDSNNDILAESSYEANIESLSTRHNTHRQHPSDDITITFPTENISDANLGSTTIRHSTQREQFANKNPTDILSKTTSVADTNSTIIRQHTHHQHLLNDDSVIFPTETRSNPNTESTSSRHSTHRQQHTNKNPTSTTTNTKFGAKKVCRYYCKGENNKYFCCGSRKLRVLFANTSLLIKDDTSIVIRDADNPDVCKHSCLGWDNGYFCCLPANEQDLYALLNTPES